MTDLQKKYNKLNDSYKKTLVFHLGRDAGFFSEYNCMILAILYCLQHNIRFVLYSKDANFAYKNGWDDYFEPFCASTTCIIHKYLNVRSFPNLNFRKISTIKWNIKILFLKIGVFVFKLMHTNIYLTQDIWPHLFYQKMKDEEFIIPELGIHGDFVHACNKLVELTWNYNPHIKKEIYNLISIINIPDNYISCQIRGGDKNLEYDLLPIEDYIKRITNHSDTKTVFVLTDDYRIIEILKSDYDTWNWYTLCDPSEKGYYHSIFKKNKLTSKKQQLIRLFSSIEIINKSELFIGTKTSNPSMFISIYNPKITIGVDYNDDLVKYYLNR
jgi:hypothetical protein